MPKTVPLAPSMSGDSQDRLESAHLFAQEQQQRAGVRQKRNYDIKSKGRHFQAGELVWVFNPQRKKGRCPKLDSPWVGPCRVLERLGEVVYRLHLPPKGRRVALHRDRLAPYRGGAAPLAQGGPATPRCRPPRLHRRGLGLSPFPQLPGVTSPPLYPIPFAPRPPFPSKGLKTPYPLHRSPGAGCTNWS